jgi:bis(5'-nucleosidyl)-tetraphosphatase
MIGEESFGIIPLCKEDGIWRVFVVLHKGGKHWGFPKGHGNSGESPIQSATRELKEETGLAVTSLLSKDPLSEKYHFKRRGKLITKAVHYFPALVSGSVQLQAEEICEGKWLPIQDALAILTFREAREICQEVVKYVESL